MIHSSFTGRYYDAGYQYGRQAYENGRFFNHPGMLRLTAEKTEFCQACLPIYEKEYPEVLEEIRGIADGQRMKFEDLAAFILGIYNFPPDNGCTCFACRSGKTVIFGRNSDFLTELEPFYENCFYRLDGGFSFIGNTTAMVQMEDGMNEHGLAAGLTFIYPVVKKPGLNAGILVRYLLEKCRDTGEALEALLKLTVSSSQTITIADRSGEMAVMECNAERKSVIFPAEGEEFVVAANDFKSPDMLEYRADLEDFIFSGCRYRTARSALGSTKNYSLAFAEELLAGKYGFMCQYDRSTGMDTVWSSVYLLDENRIYRCEGNPARKEFIEDKGRI